MTEKEHAPTEYDLTRECYCTCHIGPKRMLPTELRTGDPTGDSHFEDVANRIACSLDSFAESLPPNTCGTCGRSGADRYVEIPDMLGVNLMMAKKHGIDLGPELAGKMERYTRHGEKP